MSVLRELLRNLFKKFRKNCSNKGKSVPLTAIRPQTLKSGWLMGMVPYTIHRQFCRRFFGLAKSDRIDGDLEFQKKYQKKSIFLFYFFCLLVINLVFDSNSRGKIQKSQLRFQWPEKVSTHLNMGCICQHFCCQHF